MKKVLIFAPTAPSSGITQYVLNTLLLLEDEDIEFDILSFKNYRLKNWTVEHNTNYFEFDISMYKHPILYRRFLKNVFGRGYDTVHFNMSSVSTLNIFKIAKKCGINNIIMHSHSTLTDLSSKLRKIVFTVLHKIIRTAGVKYYDKMCACSKQAAIWMYGKKSAEKAIIINNGVDIEKFRYNAVAGQRLREELGIEEKYVIGHIGRFSYQKNQCFLIEVFEKLLEIRDDCRLVFVGDGSMKEMVQAFARQKGVGSKITFLDFCDDISSYYSAMDMVVLPSIFEGFGIVLIEAQANGLRCIASDRVPPQTNAGGRVEFLPLEKGFEFWAEKISETLDNSQRKDVLEGLCDSGFSLSAQKNIIFDLYTKQRG